MYTEKNRTLSQLGAEKIVFPSKPEWHKLLLSSFATNKRAQFSYDFQGSVFVKSNFAVP